MDHLSSDEDEEDEGDPVVVPGDEVAELKSSEPADDGHESLKAAEEEGGGDMRPWRIGFSHAEAAFVAFRGSDTS